LHLPQCILSIADIFMSVHFRIMHRKMATYVLDLHPVQQDSCILVDCGLLCTTFSLLGHIMGHLCCVLKILIR